MAGTKLKFECGHEQLSIWNYTAEIEARKPFPWPCKRCGMRVRNVVKVTRLTGTLLIGR
jgi:hypothetical protein